MTTTLESRDVRIATQSDQESVLAALTLVFCTDPGIRWYFTAPPQFNTYFPEFTKAYGGKAFEYETAYYVDEYAGAALWLPPTVEPDTDEIVDVMQAALSDEKLELVGKFIERVENSHPTEPFWELTVLGVEPAQ